MNVKTVHVRIACLTSRLCLLAVLFTSVTFSGCFKAAAQTRIEKLWAISGTNQVRAEALIRSSQGLEQIQLRAAIVAASDGRQLWQGVLLNTNLSAGVPLRMARLITPPNPRLWDPPSPALYRLRLAVWHQDHEIASSDTRFGFRSIEARDGHFYLNGRPIFLRGLAINPPGRTIPDATGQSRQFAQDYVRFMKSQNLNIFRITTDQSQTWFDVCDEEGMMLYAGHYGAPFGAEEGKRVAPKAEQKTIAAYKELLEGYVSHPAIVMYLMANELPVSGTRGAAFSSLLTQLIAELKKWDSTRPYIGNAGYGEGREGDVCDVHRYWGWYYNSFLTYYNLRDKLRPRPLFGDPLKNQPLTFTECVGSFTGSSGEFNVVRSKQLGPRLGWIGNTTTPAEDALDYQSFMLRQAIESFRRLRPLNPRLSGLMPFSILFSNWNGISNFSQMRPKPSMRQMATSYQPVLLSWECWTPQVYAGKKLPVIAHVINDDDSGRDLENVSIRYQLQTRAGKTILSGTADAGPVPYYGTVSKPLELTLPQTIGTGDYTLSGQLLAGDGRDSTLRSTNSMQVFIAGTDWLGRSSENNGKPAISLYDPPGHTIAALARYHIQTTAPANLPGLNADSRLVIGENAWSETLSARTNELRQAIANGARILILRQDADHFDTSWLPVKISTLKGSASDPDYPPGTRPHREQMNVNLERPDHPVFAGLDRRRFSLWSDYTGWNETRPGFPRVYPVTAGFQMHDAEALRDCAVLADYDRGLEGIALAEFFSGKGSIILCGLDLANRAGLDPIADRLLLNLENYLMSEEGHERFPLILHAIRWGDFPTEAGVVCGSLNGLLVNTVWVPPSAGNGFKPMPPNSGSWNMAPGDQFVPQGRNPFGPFTYSTGSSLKDLDPGSSNGTAVFYARIPHTIRSTVSEVRNPAQSEGMLRIQLNEAQSVEFKIAPDSTATCRVPLEKNSGIIRVRFTGPKTLVLLETRFE
jgi:beta-galactosidase